MDTALPFPPPTAPALFYTGAVMHQRMRPAPHRFRYSVFSLLVDLDRLDAAGRLARLFSVGRFNLIGFSPRDHGAPGETDPAAAARRLLADAGLATPVARVLLLCHPRVLGFVFNPLAVYFAYDAAERLIGIVYEVRNTFGGRHSYVAPLRAGEASAAGIRQEAEKRFHVSPFLGPVMRYHFRLRPPGTRDVAVRILETDADGPILAATFTGTALPLSDAACLRLALTMPLMTIKVVLGIHFEALRLWFKGIAVHRAPAEPEPR
ncbi:MAG: DUF1365 domain-containing protein [Hyphomicrobiales bacterium]|uniref:DUF1365 domain-containing protein n=1 Tax=Rhabdaerophilum calidifontis TaxID=2604328 RepID=UPI001239803A|nr:DUF1365 domain-containing protein [Rhabdaerophilum calidifontis]MCA1952152.1 DUF1365 domain-containing protein [Hyphomicrobiales bacterium]MCA1998847.1 DUF1365 domain-containing protein [Hyphomicrobiales bacterium]